MSLVVPVVTRANDNYTLTVPVHATGHDLYLAAEDVIPVPYGTSLKLVHGRRLIPDDDEEYEPLMYVVRLLALFPKLPSGGSGTTGGRKKPSSRKSVRSRRSKPRKAKRSVSKPRKAKRTK